MQITVTCLISMDYATCNNKGTGSTMKQFVIFWPSI